LARPVIRPTFKTSYGSNCGLRTEKLADSGGDPDQGLSLPLNPLGIPL